jgi:hypothetical protein
MCRIILGSNRDRHVVLNMDQMLVYFLMNAKRMLELIKKLVPICMLIDDTKRVIVAVTIAARSGCMLLLSMLVFKGQPNGRIATTKLATTTAYWGLPKSSC